jgi:hypothetical protein
MPELVELHEMDLDGVRVVALSLDLVIPEEVDSTEELRAFLHEHDFALPVAAFDGDLNAFADRYGLSGALPETVLIGRDGTVVDRLQGSGDVAKFRELIDAARRR